MDETRLGGLRKRAIFEIILAKKNEIIRQKRPKKRAVYRQLCTTLISLGRPTKKKVKLVRRKVVEALYASHNATRIKYLGLFNLITVTNDRLLKEKSLAHSYTTSRLWRFYPMNFDGARVVVYQQASVELPPTRIDSPVGCVAMTPILTSFPLVTQKLKSLDSHLH